MSGWSDAAAWTDGVLRREGFFFSSGGEALYGSLYASAEVSRPYGVIACNSWGVEADRSDPLIRSVVLAMSRMGGAGMTFHYPGYGDSHGDLVGLELYDLARAAVDAAEEASRRRPDIAWIMVGFMLGASVACLAQRQVAVEQLLLVQPALRPSAYFQRLRSNATRTTLGFGITEGMAYGYPIPPEILKRNDQADSAVVSALADFRGVGAVIEHPRPASLEPVPEHFERVDAPGTWRFGSRNNPSLATATADWLERRTRSFLG